MEMMKNIADNEDGIYIYGGGDIGQMVYEMLLQEKKNVKGFLISKGYKTRDSIHGLQCLEYDVDASQPEEAFSETDAVVVTTHANSRNILNSLRTVTARVYDLTTHSHFCDVYKAYYKKTLLQYSENGIKEKTIRINGYDLINPYLENEEYCLPFFQECADMILPILGLETTIEGCEGPYEVGSVKLAENDTVIDCGSNIGLFTAWAASQNCHVYAFEPSPQTITSLEFVRSQFPEMIDIIDCALSNEAGTTSFSQGAVGTTSKIVDPGDEAGSVEVRMDTIDNFVKENNISSVDFIKADIEGAERLMLRGAVNTLKTMAPKLSLCTYHLPDDKVVLEELILAANPAYKIENRHKKIYAYVP